MVQIYINNRADCGSQSKKKKNKRIYQHTDQFRFLMFKIKVKYMNKI